MTVLVEVSPAAWRGRLGLMEIGMAFALGEVRRRRRRPPCPDSRPDSDLATARASGAVARAPELLLV
jgi:hypothetical protein